MSRTLMLLLALRALQTCYISVSVNPEHLMKRTCTFLQCSTLKVKVNWGLKSYLQFSPWVLFFFPFHNVKWLIFSGIHIASFEVLGINRIPINKKINNWAIVSREESNKLLENRVGETVVLKPKVIYELSLIKLTLRC